MYLRIMRKFVFLVFCMLLIEGFVVAGESTNTITVNDDIKIQTPNLDQYQVHDPIFIDGNGGFAALGFSGSGTMEDPYLIEGVNITSTGYFALIQIANTNAHIIIRNSILNGLMDTEMGIALYNVMNAGIENNIIFDNAGQQMQLDQSSNNTIVANSISGVEGSSQGILIVDYSFNQANPSEYNFILNNTISANPDYGIGIEGSHNNYIVGNTLFMNGEGIEVKESDYNHIEGNLIINNDIGISFSPGNENVIQSNDFIGNNNQIVDNGENNLIENNYYDDWSGIGSYSIAGSANNQDISPRSNPNPSIGTTATETGGTTTVTVSQIDRSTEPNENSALDDSVILAILLVAIVGGGALYYGRKSKLTTRPKDARSLMRERQYLVDELDGFETDDSPNILPFSKICASCGTKPDQGDIFCPNCGTSFK